MTLLDVLFLGILFNLIDFFQLERDAANDPIFSKIQNKKLLFHGSSVGNFTGLLSRGLLLPKVVTDLGGKRTDAGMLGTGIYFSNSMT